MAVGTIFVDTGGATTNSGTSDANSAIVSGAAATNVTTTVTLDAGTDLSGVAVDGSQAIYLSQATNANRKIFWISGSAGSGGATPTVTVDVAPTGLTASAWAIGGRLVWTPANVESALRAGDTVQFNNSPATRTTTYFTARNSGDSTTGMIRILGKTGVRPLLEITSNNLSVFTLGALNAYYIGNLELKADAATSSGVISGTGFGHTFDNLKISQSNGAAGIAITGAGGIAFITNCEITAVGDGINIAFGTIVGNYIHACTGDGIEVAQAGSVSAIFGNVVSGNSGRGIYLSPATSNLGNMIAIINNTVYGNTLAGIEVLDVDTRVLMYNNIVMNTNSADIVKWAAGNAQLVSAHAYNLFFSSSTGVLNGLTANSTELTSNPVFTAAGSSDFTLQTTSPAKATGYPGVLLGGNTGYLDMGALQRQEPAGGSGGGMRLAGHGGLAA